MRNGFILTAVAALAFLMTGCQKNEPSVLPEVTGNTTISAVMEGSLTRSDADDSGYFTWSEGDRISVYTSKGVFKEFTLSDGAGTGTASFTGDLEAGETLASYAVYPAGDHKYSEGKLTVNLPREYGDFDTEYIANTNSVMVSAVTENGLSFRHAGGVLRFVLSNVPEGAAQFEFTANLGITGDFEISDIEGIMKIAAVEKSGENDVVTVRFKPLEEAAEEMTFFIPLPLGTYNGISIAVKNQSGDVLAEYDAPSVSNELVRAELGLLPGLDCGTDMADVVADLKKVFAQGGSYSLPKDVDITDEKLIVTAGAEVELDLNGHEIEAVNNGNITVYGKLTLKDTEGTGRIVASADYSKSEYSSGLISVKGEDALMTMEGGTIYAVREDPVNKGQFGVGLFEGADFTMNGGRIEAGWYAVSGNGTNKTQNTQITINAGELVSTADYAVYLPHSGTTNICGGTINGAAGGVLINRGTLNISGEDTRIMSQNTGDTGEWNDGTGGAPNSALCIKGEYDDCTVRIIGGNFVSKGDAVNILEQESEYTLTLNVVGGTFSDASVLPYVTSEGNVTVKLEGDVNLAEAMIVERGTVTVDLNNNILTAAGTAVAEGTTVAGQNVAIYVSDGARLKAVNGKIGDDSQALFYGVFGKGDAEVTLEGVEFGERVTYAYNGAGAKLDADNCVFKGWLSGWGNGSATFDGCTFTIGKAYVPAVICYGSTVFTDCSFFKNGTDPDDDSYTGAPDADGYIRCNYIVAACNPATTIDFNSCKFVDGSNVKTAITAADHPYHSCGHGDGTVADAQIKVDGTPITTQCSGAQKEQ